MHPRQGLALGLLPVGHVDATVAHGPGQLVPDLVGDDVQQRVDGDVAQAGQVHRLAGVVEVEGHLGIDRHGDAGGDLDVGGHLGERDVVVVGVHARGGQGGQQRVALGVGAQPEGRAAAALGGDVGPVGVIGGGEVLGVGDPDRLHRLAPAGELLLALAQGGLVLEDARGVLCGIHQLQGPGVVRVLLQHGLGQGAGLVELVLQEAVVGRSHQALVARGALVVQAPLLFLELAVGLGLALLALGALVAGGQAFDAIVQLAGPGLDVLPGDLVARPGDALHHAAGEHLGRVDVLDGQGALGAVEVLQRLEAHLLALGGVALGGRHAQGGRLGAVASEDRLDLPQVVDDDAVGRVDLAGLLELALGGLEVEPLFQRARVGQVALHQEEGLLLHQFEAGAFGGHAVVLGCRCGGGGGGQAQRQGQRQPEEQQGARQARRARHDRRTPHASLRSDAVARPADRRGCGSSPAAPARVLRARAQGSGA